MGKLDRIVDCYGKNEKKLKVDRPDVQDVSKPDRNSGDISLIRYSLGQATRGVDLLFMGEELPASIAGIRKFSVLRSLLIVAGIDPEVIKFGENPESVFENTELAQRLLRVVADIALDSGSSDDVRRSYAECFSRVFHLFLDRPNLIMPLLRRIMMVEDFDLQELSTRTVIKDGFEQKVTMDDADVEKNIDALKQLFESNLFALHTNPNDLEKGRESIEIFVKLLRFSSVDDRFGVKDYLLQKAKSGGVSLWLVALIEEPTDSNIQRFLDNFYCANSKVLEDVFMLMGDAIYGKMDDLDLDEVARLENLDACLTGAAEVSVESCKEFLAHFGYFDEEVVEVDDFESASVDKAA